MGKNFFYGSLIIIALSATIGSQYSSVFAQCNTDVTLGLNVVVNGDFSQGYTGWSHSPSYIRFNPPFTQNYSSPGYIHVGPTASYFNAAFIDFDDHTPSPNNDNMMLMVDGLCTSGVKLWEQIVPIVSNTTYYFSVWVHALKNGNNPPGTLQFKIDNSTAGLSNFSITAPTSQATGWILYEATWTSPVAAPATATISIENTTTSGCDQYVDFAIDDIAFIPGCQYSATPIAQPDLGPDQTLCGGNSPITLNAGVTPASDVTVTWSNNVPAPVTGTGTDPNLYSKTISTPGTYSVCVQKGSSCLRSDVMVVSDNYSINIGGPYQLCNPISQLLDAQHSGVGVTYRWYFKDGAGAWVDEDTIPGSIARQRTYTASMAGRYRVVVTDASCGVRESETTITSSATATPADAYFCPPDKQVLLSVQGSATGVYNWYDSPGPGGTPLTGGTNTTSYITQPISATTIYYVEDAEVKTTFVGPPSLPSGANSQQVGHSDKAILFTARVPFTIDSATVYWWFDNNNGHENTVINVQFKLTNSPAGYNIAATTLQLGPTYSSTISAETAAGRMTPPWPTSSNNIYGVRVPVGISVPAAGDYRLAMEQANGNIRVQNSMVSYVYPDQATGGDIAVISSSKLGQNPITLSEYHDIYNWRISYKTPCARVPVRAIAECIMPVDLTSFYVVPLSQSNFVYWTTIREENSSHYIIERSSDGITFDEIGQVNGAGSSLSQREYLFKDMNPLPGVSYYRLVQFDLDGSYTYSKIVKVNRENYSEMKIYPNPAKDRFTVILAGLSNNFPVKITIYNSLGQLISDEQEEVSREIFVREYNTSGLSSGLYIGLTE